MSTEPELLYSANYLRLMHRGGWEYVQRINATGVVGIVAVTPAGNLILVEQYRPAVNCAVIELPAGLVGDVAGKSDEPITLAARRELLEETGYEAQDMDIFTTGASSAGLTSETLTLCIARGLSKVAAGGGEHSESIQVHEIPISSVHSWVLGQVKQGKLLDFKIFVALYLVACDGGRE